MHSGGRGCSTCTGRAYGRSLVTATVASRRAHLVIFGTRREALAHLPSQNPRRPVITRLPRISIFPLESRSRGRRGTVLDFTSIQNADTAFESTRSSYAIATFPTNLQGCSNATGQRPRNNFQGKKKQGLVAALRRFSYHLLPSVHIGERWLLARFEKYTTQATEP